MSIYIIILNENTWDPKFYTMLLFPEVLPARVPYKFVFEKTSGVIHVIPYATRITHSSIYTSKQTCVGLRITGSTRLLDLSTSVNTLRDVHDAHNIMGVTFFVEHKMPICFILLASFAVRFTHKWKSVMIIDYGVCWDTTIGIVKKGTG